MKQGDQVEVFKPWAAQGGGRPPLYEWFDGYEVVELEEDCVLVWSDGHTTRERRDNVRPRRVAILADGQPRDDGRVSFTALWKKRGRLRPRAQCFFADPVKHFSAWELKFCTTDEEAIAWLERRP